MNNQKLIIQSLAMDLKRIALSLHRGSFKVADRFREEASKRQAEIECQKTSVYLNKLLRKSEQLLKGKDDRVAENALMLSTLFQNYSLKLM